MVFNQDHSSIPFPAQKRLCICETVSKREGREEQKDPEKRREKKGAVAMLTCTKAQSPCAQHSPTTFKGFTESYLFQQTK